MKLEPLHEFMSRHRDELLLLSVRDMQVSAPDPDAEEFTRGVGELIDQMIRALQHEAGLPVSSPLPDTSEVAMWLGSRRQARGHAIARIAKDIGAISNTVGALARSKQVAFAASEYQIFNQCVDGASAAAIDEYWHQAQDQREREETERVGMVVHELRNTLAGARLSFSVLQRAEVGIRSKTGDVLDRSLRRLESLIAEMVFAVRLSSGTALKSRRIAVAEMLRDVMDAAVPERGIVLRSDVDTDLQLDADPQLLISAVSNLIQNAFKFTHDGGQITLRAYRQEASVMIEVEDECGGLPPGRPEQLFEPFVSKGADQRGLGLGLTITREAVEAHGGQVSVTNLPGKGCVFRLMLPRSQ